MIINRTQATNRTDVKMRQLRLRDIRQLNSWSGSGLICPVQSSQLNLMKKIFFAVVFSVLFFQVRMASALTFKITYDGSVLTNSPDPVAITNAFGTAAQAFSDLFTNVATINIQVYWGPVGPFTGGIGLGRSQFQLVGSTYSGITNAL